MMSLSEVWHAAEVLEATLEGTVLQRVVQPDPWRLVMEFYGREATHSILLACRPRFAHIGALGRLPKAPPVPPGFVQYLRARFSRAVFVGVTTSKLDRRLGVRLTSGAGVFEIVLSILGNRSNIYLLDERGVLLYVLRPLAETRRELVVGSPWINPEGSPKSEGVDRWASVPTEKYLSAIEETYAVLERNDEASALARRLEHAFAWESEYLERKSVNLLQDLGDAVQADENRRKGELLKQVLHTIRPGDDSVPVTDFATGESLSIPLDPRLSPAENLAAYFKRYEKELRTSEALQQQLRNLRRVQEEIAALQRRLNGMLGPSGPDLAPLQDFAAEPRVRKLLLRFYPGRKEGVRKSAPKPPKRKEVPGRLQPRRFRTDQGLEIWVGRSEDGNDYLTTRLARGNDLFFHLEGYPGSHVILRVEGAGAPPDESVLAACELAVHFSKLKDARRADVHVTSVKDVRKPKGAKPGLVYAARGKTIHLRRDPKRLENILAARLDE